MSALPPLSGDELDDVRADLSAVLSETCTIERDEALDDAPDPYGQAPPSAWVPLAQLVPCTYWQTSGDTTMTEGREVVVEQRLMAVPHGTDVRESDRVRDVRGPDGAIREAGPLRIDAVTERASHVELALTEVDAA